MDVIRYTTFFHQFTLVFDELRREKYVDWYGYSASVSLTSWSGSSARSATPSAPSTSSIRGTTTTSTGPSREFLDFQAFQRREVAKLAQEMVDITHERGKEAMMFLAITGSAPSRSSPEFQTIGLTR